MGEFMNATHLSIFQNVLQTIRDAGVYKTERIIDSPQGVEIRLADGRTVLNFCANNYLGLSSHPKVIESAHRALDQWGYGMSSVRFICGTQTIHKALEEKISQFLGTDDAILYAACFDANGGIFEPLFGEEDVIFTDALNHASIIDGVRLCKAKRVVYQHLDMEDLENHLRASEQTRLKVIVTDGVFSMDGEFAPLPKMCSLAEKYNALVFVDDSHATGFIGKSGRGTPEFFGVEDRIDLMTTTFGKALGGASGGCAAGRKVLIELLRQRSRPYLFSNTLSPVIVGTTLAILDMTEELEKLREKLKENTLYFRKGMSALGFQIKAGEHPIVPVMLYEEKKAISMAEALLDEGIYVIGFSYPVVPKGQARIRIQISALHEKRHLDQALCAFEKVGKKLHII